jgi:hypothetical protein
VTAAAVIQIITWAAKAVAAIWGVVQEAMKKVEPPTSAELKKKLHDIIDAGSDDWIKAGKAEADAALAAAAQAEFDAGLKDALKDKDKG